ncbi:hypothetical protein CBS147321_7116 [Aspergillus niger]|nr:hypothetical protein CBS12448_2585 [Aspergillus niger]KAI2918023.1 hypothetical protein CBS147371_4315 [Aspergillus niger]KAI2938875.1 hypothetical protein CBS147321_7116 [Aspergillus niger]KAI2975197.1 hypothetical protein CBS147323_1067 [Aspergillus niger]KAI2977511.1 hypothetical protein CBS147324_2185 [Aspergillus niger]
MWRSIRLSCLKNALNMRGFENPIHPLKTFHDYHHMALQLEPNGLYLLLADRESSSTFHWGLYLAKSPTDGTIFNLINFPNPNVYSYEVKSDQKVITSRRYLLALKVGDLHPALHGPLETRLSQIPIQYSTRFHEAMTCRVWVKEALFALDDEGYIKLVESINGIEAEARFGQLCTILPSDADILIA